METETVETTKLQRLFEACCTVLTDQDPPSYRRIQWLRRLLDSIEASDVGINEFGSESPSCYRSLIDGQSLKTITYIHIFECEYFSMGIFCFPAGAKLPLHDHPGMTVLSKLLYGSMYVKAYDWALPNSNATLIEDQHQNNRTVGLAGLAIDEVLDAPCEPLVLFPRSGGNIHSFTSLTPSAFLDILTPPYSQEFDRPSTYFSEIPIRALPGYAVLEEIEMPKDLVVEGAPFLGPKLRAFVLEEEEEEEEEEEA